MKRLQTFFSLCFNLLAKSSSVVGNMNGSKLPVPFKCESSRKSPTEGREIAAAREKKERRMAGNK